jgi:hypothetical protein
MAGAIISVSTLVGTAVGTALGSLFGFFIMPF